MSIDNKDNKANRNAADGHEDSTLTGDQNQKPHVIRRNIEDYLADRALKKRLADIFDDDFILD